MSEAGVENQVQCEKIDFFNEFKICLMDGRTRIGLQGYLISSAEDLRMEQLNLNSNKNIFFLPENIGQKYPNLLKIWAIGCSIKSISRRVFSNLVTLKQLKLMSNQIEELESEMFKDLKSLEELDLGEFT